MEQKTLCQKCGAEIGTDDAFCSNCGAPQDAGHTEKISVCTNCGAEIKPGSTFCPNCGTRLAGEQSAGHQQTAEQTSANTSFKTAESGMNGHKTSSVNDPVKNIAEYIKNVNSLCIVAVVVFLFGLIFYRSIVVMIAAFVLSIIGYSDAKKKNQIGKIATLICMILSACIGLVELISLM